MIKVLGLTKRYGTKEAVKNISFSIAKGEIVGFLGPNGAGKTTTMNIITGYISATAGKALIAGFDVLDDPIYARQHIGYLPEHPPLYQDMTVNEYLRFVYNLKKVRHRKFEKHISEICELVGISHVRGRVIGNLSKGYKQRVGLAQSLIGDPDVLILDEPTVGLDPNQIIEIRNVIKNLGRERTIILSTHILPEVNAVCERVIVINDGVIVADDKPENLAKKIAKQNRFSARIVGESQAVVNIVSGVPGVAGVKFIKNAEENAGDYIITSDETRDIRQPLFYALAENNMPYLSFTSYGVSLEDVFAKLTQQDSEHSKEELSK
ncbi:MAG: ATP-binding cassette domain-containing protein [Clostridiales bacterium]|jgi:ABC-2 type transport system ATP-binding protein|nr:ATP-binding cassette domain-containing protein [Clostridiales bacterium]